MKCARCGKEFEYPFKPIPNNAICGNCADDLRQEANAQQAMATTRSFSPNLK